MTNSTTASTATKSGVSLVKKRGVSLAKKRPIHEGTPLVPEGKHDYEAFETASQFPDGLIRLICGKVWRWNLARNTWDEVA